MPHNNALQGALCTISKNGGYQKLKRREKVTELMNKRGLSEEEALEEVKAQGKKDKKARAALKQIGKSRRKAKKIVRAKAASEKPNTLNPGNETKIRAVVSGGLPGLGKRK